MDSRILTMALLLLFSSLVAVDAASKFAHAGYFNAQH